MQILRLTALLSRGAVKIVLIIEKINKPKQKLLFRQ